jgi:hypothetical protein
VPKKITVSIPKDIAPDLKKLAYEKGCSEEEIAFDALQRRIAIFRLSRLRAKMITPAQEMGINTDQDVFDRVS